MKNADVPADVRAYLDTAEGERGEALRMVFDTVQAAMPAGYELELAWGMPTWVVPLATLPDTYNGKALVYVSLAAQKRYNALYLMTVAGADEDGFRERWEATGRTLDMGKSCLRFRSLDDVDLGILHDTVSAVAVEEYVEKYRSSRR